MLYTSMLRWQHVRAQTAPFKVSFWYETTPADRSTKETHFERKEYGQDGLAASWSGKMTEKGYTCNALAVAFQIVAADEVQNIVAELLAQQPALISDVLKSISPPPKTSGQHTHMHVDSASSAQPSPAQHSTAQHSTAHT